jgi:hypothetical protein
MERVTLKPDLFNLPPSGYFGRIHRTELLMAWTGLPAQGIEDSITYSPAFPSARGGQWLDRLSFPSRLRGSGRITIPAHSTSLTSSHSILPKMKKFHFISYFSRCLQYRKSDIKVSDFFLHRVNLIKCLIVNTGRVTIDP